MKKKKILYIVSSLVRSGPTNQLLGLISEVNSEKYDLEILTISSHPNNSRHKDFEREKVKVTSLNLSKKMFLIKGKKLIKSIIDIKKPDIIHTSGIRADSILSKLKLNNHCMTIHNYAFEDYVDKFGGLLGNIMAKKTIKNMRNCDYNICCSHTLKRKYSQVGINNLYSVQNGINTECYQPANNYNDIFSVRKALNISEEKLIFLVTGTLRKVKDPVTIVKAFKNAEVENSELIFLGDGPLFEDLKKIIGNNKNIKLKGNVSNVSEYLKAADFYISASHSEGMPMSVLEAGSSGLNMILSNIEQHLEIFSNANIEINTFNVGNVSELSTILKEIEAEPGRTNYKISRYINENFDNRIMSDKYEKIYKKIISENK